MKKGLCSATRTATSHTLTTLGVMIKTEVGTEIDQSDHYLSVTVTEVYLLNIPDNIPEKFLNPQAEVIVGVSKANGGHMLNVITQN